MPLPVVMLGVAVCVAAPVVLRKRQTSIRTRLRAVGRRKTLVATNVAGIKTAGSGLSSYDTLDVAEREQNGLEIKVHEADHMLLGSGLALVTAWAGQLVFAPLKVVSFGLSLYTSWPIVNAARSGLVKQRRVNAAALDSVFIVGSLVTGYFAATAIGSMVYFFGQKLVLRTENRSRKKLDALFGEKPQSLWVVVDGVEVETPIEEVLAGHIIVVNAGQTLAVDGTVVSGAASVDQHMLTGESQPVDRIAGDPVLAATVVISGRIQVRVDQAGVETVAAGVAEILNNTADHRSSVELRTTQLADAVALPTIALGGATLFLMNPISAIAVMGCNFSEIVRIVAPLSTLSYLDIASKRRVLIKDGRSLELLGDIDTIVFDKTGTLTLERPKIGAVHILGELDENQALSLAAAAEHRQTHPIAEAIRAAAEQRDLQVPQVDPASYEIGFGICVRCEGQTLHIGSARFMQSEGIRLPADIDSVRSRCDAQGHSLVYLAVDNKPAAAFELHTEPRPESAAVVRALKEQGIDVYMISGDHAAPTQHLADQLGIKHWFADTLPEDKAKHIRRLRELGRSVCFVGDGINDTIAMKEALVSVSVNGATTAATNTAGIVLMDSNLALIGELMELSRAYQRNLRTSFTVTLGPGLVGLGSIFLFGIGIYGTLAFYGMSLALGASNATLPLLLDRRDRDRGERRPELLLDER